VSEFVPPLRWSERRWVCVHLPSYNPEAVWLLRQLPLRAYDREKLEWWVPADALPEVEEILVRFFAKYEIGPEPTRCDPLKVEARGPIIRKKGG
jgi:hypothetical protein